MAHKGWIELAGPALPCAGHVSRVSRCWDTQTELVKELKNVVDEKEREPQTDPFALLLGAFAAGEGSDRELVGVRES